MAARWIAPRIYVWEDGRLAGFDGRYRMLLQPPLPGPLSRKRVRGELHVVRWAVSHAFAAPLPPPSPRCAVGGSFFYRVADFIAHEIL